MKITELERILYRHVGGRRSGLKSEEGAGL